MARHRSRLVPPGGPRTVRRRPTLPGVQRAQVPLGRLGDPRALAPGLESFAGAAFDPVGGTTRGTPQQRSDLAARTAALGRNAAITPPSSFLGPGPGLPTIGADDPTRGLGQPGPATGGVGPPATGGFGGIGGVRVGGFSFGGGLGVGETGQFATPSGTLAAEQGRGVQFPGPGEGFGSLDAAGIAARNLDPRTGRPLQHPEDRRGPGGGLLPPVPFQSFDDFFASRRLARQFQTQIENPFPAGGGFRFTQEQARVRAAGGDPGESTFIGAPGQQAAGQLPGGSPSGAAPPIQQAGPPTGAFGFGRADAAQPSSAAVGTAGQNAGLLEQQALFAALKEAFMERLLGSLGRLGGQARGLGV